MENLQEFIATLKDLDLTTVQAKTYIALIKSDILTIREIAAISKVPRTDLYRSIRELEKKGLVERVLSKPNRFKAIPIGECFDVLYSRIAKRDLELQKRISKLRHDFRNNEHKRFTEADFSKYILVPKGRVIERIGKAINGTYASIEVVSSWERFSTTIFLLADELANAWNRGVKCRCVIEKPGSKEVLSKGLGSYLKNPFCEVRFIPTSPQTVVSIYDGKVVIIIENPAAALTESSVLWSNNRCLISMAKEFFEKLWITAMEDPDFQKTLKHAA